MCSRPLVINQIETEEIKQEKYEVRYAPLAINLFHCPAIVCVRELLLGKLRAGVHGSISIVCACVLLPKASASYGYCTYVRVAGVVPRSCATRTCCRKVHGGRREIGSGLTDLATGTPHYMCMQLHTNRTTTKLVLKLNLTSTCM